MKKILGILFIVLGIITTSIGAITPFFDVKSDMPSSIAIIGGADGPTAVFIAGKFGAPMYGAIIVGIVVFVIGLLLVLLKKKQDQ